MVKWYHIGFPSRYHGFESRCPLFVCHCLSGAMLYGNHDTDIYFPRPLPSQYASSLTHHPIR